MHFGLNIRRFLIKWFTIKWVHLVVYKSNDVCHKLKQQIRDRNNLNFQSVQNLHKIRYELHIVRMKHTICEKSEMEFRMSHGSVTG